VGGAFAPGAALAALARNAAASVASPAVALGSGKPHRAASRYWCVRNLPARVLLHRTGGR